MKLKIKLTTIADIKEFLNAANKLECDIDVIKGRYVVDAKSTIGLYTLDLSDPVEVYIHSDNIYLIENFRKWEVK